MLLLVILCSLLSSSSVYAQSFHLPKEMNSVMNKRLASHGPNCWGTALYLKGISPVPRFVSSAEITYWQESSLCKALNVGEQIRPGDILNVYGPEYTFDSDKVLTDSQEFINLFEPGRYKGATESRYSGFHRLLHSETFVNSHQVFGKESPNKNDAFKFTKLAEVYGRPRGDSECQESPILAPHLRQFDNKPQKVKGSKCDYFSKVYRCENFNTFLTLNAEDKNLMNEIGKYQKRIFEAVITSSKRLSNNEKKQIRAFANYQLQEIEVQRVNVTDEESRMILSWKYFSAYSLIESINWIEDV